MRSITPFTLEIGNKTIRVTRIKTYLDNNSILPKERFDIKPKRYYQFNLIIKSENYKNEIKNQKIKAKNIEDFKFELRNLLFRCEFNK